MALPHSKF